MIMKDKGLRRFHEKNFGRVESQVWAPGRINLIGEHTDYNNGYVLPAAIDRGIHFLFSLNEDRDRFVLYSSNLEEKQSFHRSDAPLPSDNWAKYLQALVDLLAEKENIKVKEIIYTCTYFCNLIYTRKKNKQAIRKSDHELFLGTLFALMKLKIIENDESNGYLVMPKKKT